MTTLTEIRGSYSFASSLPPVAAYTTISQRSNKTFLVDVGFELSKDGAHHRYGAFKYGAQKYGPDDYIYNSNIVNADFSRDGGNTWLSCTAQSYDRKHTATNPMPIDATPQEFDFVWNAFFDLPDDFYGEVIFRFEFSGSSTVIITSSPIIVSTVVAPETYVKYHSPSHEFRIDDFLGDGPIAPWRRGPSDFMTARGVELVNSAIRMILNTNAANVLWGGELAWDPDFGTMFWTLKHERGDDITTGLAFLHAKKALEFEPRVDLKNVTVEYQDRANRRAMLIHINYDVISQNIPGNQVILPEPNEVVIEVI